MQGSSSEIDLCKGARGSRPFFFFFKKIPNISFFQYVEKSVLFTIIIICIDPLMLKDYVVTRNLQFFPLTFNCIQTEVQILGKLLDAMHYFIKTDKQILESEIDMTMDRRIKRNTFFMDTYNTQNDKHKQLMVEKFLLFENATTHG